MAINLSGEGIFFFMWQSSLVLGRLRMGPNSYCGGEQERASLPCQQIY